MFRRSVQLDRALEQGHRLAVQILGLVPGHGLRPGGIARGDPGGDAHPQGEATPGAQPGRGPPDEVAPGPPRLVLAAVSQLVS